MPIGREAPSEDADDAHLEVSPPSGHAAGVPGVAVALARSWEQMGVRRTVRTLPRVNQKNGFDCPGCAWPEADRRHVAEFCENGAKAVAEEATTRRITRKFFAAHPVDKLAERSDHWLGQQGRLTEPMVREAGAEHNEPVSWDDAIALVADELRDLHSPEDAVFYRWATCSAPSGSSSAGRWA